MERLCEYCNLKLRFMQLPDCDYFYCSKCGMNLLIKNNLLFRESFKTKIGTVHFDFEEKTTQINISANKNIKLDFIAPLTPSNIVEKIKLYRAFL